MAKVKRIVDGIVVEVDEPTMVKVIENGVVVERPASEVQSLQTSPEKKSPIGSSTQGLQGLGGSSGGNLPSPLSASATPPETPFIGAGRLDALREPASKVSFEKPPVNPLAEYERISSKRNQLQKEKVSSLEGPFMRVLVGFGGGAAAENYRQKRIAEGKKAVAATDKEFGAAKRSAMSAVENIVKDRIGENIKEFTTQDFTGVSVPDAGKVKEWAQKVARENGVPEDGWTWKALESKATDHVAFKIVEPRVNKAFEKMWKQETGKDVPKDVNEYLGVTQKKIEIERSLESDLEREKSEVESQVNEQLASVTGGMSIEEYSQARDAYYEQKIGGIRSKYAQFITPQNEFAGTPEQYAQYKMEFDSAQKEYSSELSKTAAEITQIQVNANRRFNRVQTERIEQADRMMNEFVSEKEKLIPGLKKQIESTYQKAYKSVSNESDSWKEDVLRENKFLTLGFSAASAVGGSINRWGSLFGSPEMQATGKAMENFFYTGNPNMENLSDWLDLFKAAKSTGNLMGSMTTSVAPALAVGAASGGLGGVALGTIISWAGESVDIAAGIAEQIYDKTGDPAKVQEGVSQAFSAQKLLLPAYFIEMSNVFGKIFTGGGIGRRVALGAGTEYLTETFLQEAPQQFFEESIVAGKGLEGFLDNFRPDNFEKTAEKLKDVAVNTPSVMLMGGLGQARAYVDEQGKQEERAELIRERLSSINSRMRAGDFTGTDFQQSALKLTIDFGVEEASKAATSAYFNGGITYETFTRVEQALNDAKEITENVNAMEGITDENRLLFSIMNMEHRDLERRAEKEQDPIFKARAKKEANERKAMLDEIFEGGTPSYATAEFGDGSFKVMTPTGIKKAMSNPSFMQEVVDGKIKFNAFGKDSKQVVEGFAKTINDFKQSQREKVDADIANRKKERAQQEEYEAEREGYLIKREDELDIIPDIMEPAPKFVTAAITRVEDDKPTSLSQIEAASDWLYSEYKRILQLKQNPKDNPLSEKRTTELLDAIAIDIELLENAKAKMLENGNINDPVKNSTPTDEMYATVNEGGGVRNLTKQEYLDWKAPTVEVNLPQMTLRASNPFDDRLTKLGWADADIAKMTMEQKQEFVINNTKAPVVENSAKVDAVKENSKQERIAEMQRGLDDEPTEGGTSKENKQTQAEPVKGVEEAVIPKEKALSLSERINAAKRSVEKKSPIGDILSRAQAYNRMGKRMRQGAIGNQLFGEMASIAKENGWTVTLQKTGSVRVLDENGKEVRATPVFKTQEEKKESGQAKRDAERRKFEVTNAEPQTVEHWVAMALARGTRFSKKAITSILGSRADIPAWMWSDKGVSLEFLAENMRNDGFGMDTEAEVNQDDVIEAIRKYATKSGRQEAFDFAQEQLDKMQGKAPIGMEGATEAEWVEREQWMEANRYDPSKEDANEMLRIDELSEDDAAVILAEMEKQGEYESSEQFTKDLQKYANQNGKASTTKTDVKQAETRDDVSESETERTDLAKRIRDKKIGGISFVDPLFGAIGISKALYDGALELAARQVEKGTKLGTAIANAIKYIDERMSGKKWDKKAFESSVRDPLLFVENPEIFNDLKDEAMIYVKQSKSTPTVKGLADYFEKNGVTGLELAQVISVFDAVKDSAPKREAPKPTSKEDVAKARKDEHEKAVAKLEQAKKEATEKAAKAKESAKESKEKAVQSAIEKAKQKYVNIGARIGEAFGKAEGEVVGMEKGLKQAAQMQKWFAKQVNTLLDDMISEAKEISPDFTVTPKQLKAITKKLLAVNPFSKSSFANAVEYMEKVLEDAAYLDKMDKVRDMQKVVRKRKHPAFQSAVNQFLSIRPEQLPDELVEPYMEALEDMNRPVPSYRKMQDMFFDVTQHLPSKRKPFKAIEEIDAVEKLFNRILEREAEATTVDDYLKLLKDIRKWRDMAERVIPLESNHDVIDEMEPSLSLILT